MGYEVLGSDADTASIPNAAALLHKFNGWADKFLGIPADGLEDFYGSLSYKLDHCLIESLLTTP